MGQCGLNGVGECSSCCRQRCERNGQIKSIGSASGALDNRQDAQNPQESRWSSERHQQGHLQHKKNHACDDPRH